MKYEIINPENLNYEKGMKRLSIIVESLENEKIDLENALDLYKEGYELTQYCKIQIEKIESEVKKIKVIDEKDSITEENIK